ncbi:GGDEF domain-containing protein [Rhodococcus sp. P1Y]|uniref:GGDEF domain-containing protein n=1 Tax=Rhodococcus sp. P1Y TaxID=1302308 RepID=UPI000EAD7D30|nr:GGDEF domain-containing protein [Rhodococcus sp. P1Y]AYJ47674.1 GGDEF domain-containing protein [Rhodococcus sp. P1Y]
MTTLEAKVNARETLGARRSGRHRRSWLSQGSAAFSDWFHAPHDYSWIVQHRSVRHLHPVIRGVFCAATLIYALTSAIMMFSPRGPQGLEARAWVCFMLVVQLGVAYVLLTCPVPNKLGFVAFGIFGDVGLASVLVCYDATAATMGSALFVVTGAYCIFFLSPRWMVAHLLFACGFVVFSAWRGWSTSGEHPATTLAVLTVILTAVAGVPVFAHIAWTAIGGDARRSARDPLTGLLNRRGLDSAVLDLWDAAVVRSESIAVAMVDVDKFKAVNDIHGHDAGDRVLINIARRLEGVVGSCGVAARTGGEEFVVVMTGERTAVEFRMVQALSVVHDESDEVPITASFGVTVLESDSVLRSAGHSIVGRMLRSSDAMMYRSKAAGGNRISVASL